MLTNSNIGGGNLELNCHKNKGFTLIELISVIILMGVIALITVPIIKDTIESAREKNFKNSALGLIEAANEYYLNSKLTGDYFEEIEFKVNNGKMVSGNKELSFNGKVPVGDSYVKIKANGDVAINITDGEFYAVKDYDEIGVSINGSEEPALTREELAKKIAELEKIASELANKIENNTTNISELENEINDNKKELTNKIDNNSTNINNNKGELETKISNTKTELESKINSNFDKIYPVGSIYISTSSANPSTIYGGTWERYGQGKTLVGLNEGEPEFNTINKTGGEKTHTLTINEMPSHNHNLGGHTFLWGENVGTVNIKNANAETGATSQNRLYTYQNQYGWVNTLVNGGSQPHNNLQPYITVYMWKRTS